MVKDKHAKALDFIVNMKFNDSCIGFASEMEHCSCLMQFLDEEVTPSDGKTYFTSKSYQLWHDV